MFVERRGGKEAHMKLEVQDPAVLVLTPGWMVADEAEAHEGARLVRGAARAALEKRAR